MKSGHDFSAGVRGKFFCPAAEWLFPVQDAVAGATGNKAATERPPAVAEARDRVDSKDGSASRYPTARACGKSTP